MSPDTVKFTTSRRMKAIPRDWTINETRKSGHSVCYERMSSPRDRIRLSGRRIGKEYWISSVETELPRMLWGHNGRLITTQQQVDRAFEKLSEELNAVSTSFGNEEIHYFTRMDLTWHFPLNFKELPQVLKDIRPFGIQRPPIIKAGSMGFLGTQIQMAIYDKVALAKKKWQLLEETGPVTRVEIRLMRDKLKQIYGNGQYPTEVLLSRCQEVYRELLKQCDSVLLLTKGTKLARFFLAAEKQPRNKLVDLYIQHAGIKHRRAQELRREITAASIQREAFSLSKYLPLGSETNALHIYMKGEDKTLNK